jgi:hypothetical protein
LADFRARAALERARNFARQELKWAVLSDIKIDNQLITAQMSRIAGCKMQHQNNILEINIPIILDFLEFRKILDSEKQISPLNSVSNFTKVEKFSNF